MNPRGTTWCIYILIICSFLWTYLSGIKYFDIIYQCILLHVFHFILDSSFSVWLPPESVPHNNFFRTQTVAIKVFVLPLRVTVYSSLAPIRHLCPLLQEYWEMLSKSYYVEEVLVGQQCAPSFCTDSLEEPNPQSPNLCNRLEKSTVVHSHIISNFNAIVQTLSYFFSAALPENSVNFT